jgi:hypothetical protein
MKKLLLITPIVATVAVVSLTTGHAGVTIVPASGYSITYDGNDGDFFDAAAPPGGAMAPNNAALASNGGVPFASAPVSLHTPPHAVVNLNDGFYGNTNSHINGQGTGPGNMGVMLAQAHNITAFAFGRDNGNGAFDDSASGTDCCGGQLDDRVLGLYDIEFTADGGSNWTSVGTITLDGADIDATPGGLFTPWFRHEYGVGLGGGGPIVGDGIRIVVPDLGTAIDEIEVYGTVVPEPSGAVLFGLGLFGLFLRRRR